jgi:hypothetical protein
MDFSSLTPEQAYLAMYEFLVGLYNRTGSDDLGAALGGMSYLSDGETADPAAWKDWTRCVEKVLAGRSDPHLQLR